MRVSIIACRIARVYAIRKPIINYCINKLRFESAELQLVIDEQSNKRIHTMSYVEIVLRSKVRSI